MKKCLLRSALLLVLGLCAVAPAGAAQTDEKARDVLPLPLGRNISDRFVGTVHRYDLINTEDAHHLPQTNVVTFDPCSRSGWHVHGAMTVVGVSGTGIYQAWDEPAVLIRQGDVVQIPAGTVHWHGATADSQFQQIVIYDAAWQAPEGAPAHTGTVTDEEYRNLTFVDAADRKSEPPAGSDFLFAHPREPFVSPNFNKPVYVSKIVEQPNAANTPDWYYVVFPAGAYNRWHSHGAGQVLLVTDGEGYHQIKGEAPQLLHPGDVVYCPPGVVHWHGAAPGKPFAHIAISPGDNHEVTWYDFPREEYQAIGQEPS